MLNRLETKQFHNVLLRIQRDHVAANERVDVTSTLQMDDYRTKLYQPGLQHASQDHNHSFALMLKNSSVSPCTSAC